MYSILIVDDERYMREGISKMLPWASLEIDWVDTAESGTRALKKMEAHMPDIVLTDIEMKNMDGLALIREMNRRNPALRIIVLSGHDDFSYVQECCRMEVHDYLLKPVEMDKLVNAIRTQVEALERLAQQRIADRVSSFAEQMQVERLLHRFFTGEAPAEAVEGLLRGCGFERGERLQIAVLPPEPAVENEWSSRQDLLGLSMKSVCMELIDSNRDGLTIMDEKGMLILLLFQGIGHPEGTELTKRLQTILQNEYNGTRRAYLGRVVDTVPELQDSYRDAVLLRCHGRRSGGLSQAERKDSLLRVQKELEESLGNREQAMQAFAVCWDELLGCGYSAGQLRQSCFQMLSAVYYHWLEETGNTADQALTDLLVRLQSAGQEEVYEVGRSFLEQLLEEGQKKNDDVIERAKRYIANHLDQSLSVTQLANQFYLSVAYFSKRFKKNTGVGCNYYIVCQRMERAKSLLRSGDLKVGLVADQVGYKDINYFSLAFKKYTGMSPAEYREQEGTYGKSAGDQ